MVLNEIQELIERDLKRLQKELHLFDHPEKIWQTAGHIQNSSGHLTLHICGNLRHFIGHVLGNTNYKRNRETEFDSNPLTLTILTSEIENTISDIKATLLTLDPKTLGSFYPIEVLGNPMTISFFLVHLQGHINYHLGQITYLRRMLN